MTSIPPLEIFGYFGDNITYSILIGSTFSILLSVVALLFTRRR